MKRDKQYAQKGERRIPEARFWKMAVLGGAFGLYIGMHRYRHKTKHRSFIVGVPIFMIIWAMFIVNLILQRIFYP